MSDSLIRQHILVRHGAYLPHWTSTDAIYAVCFRLANSLPREVMADWQCKRTDWCAPCSGDSVPPPSGHGRRSLSLDVESYLDAGNGACWLRQRRIARVVADALHRFDGIRYQLLAWCIMPNHVHVVVEPLHGHLLPAILKSWKGYSGRQANQMLNLCGAFWQPEYYDHLIRSTADLACAVEYVMKNPVRAGLKNWPWVWVKAERDC